MPTGKLFRAIFFGFFYFIKLLLSVFLYYNICPNESLLFNVISSVKHLWTYTLYEKSAIYWWYNNNLLHYLFLQTFFCSHYLVDNHGYVVASNLPEEHVNKFFGSVENDIMADLVMKNVFTGWVFSRWRSSFLMYFFLFFFYFIPFWWKD